MTTPKIQAPPSEPDGFSQGRILKMVYGHTKLFAHLQPPPISAHLFLDTCTTFGESFLTFQHL
jgi:hypothetical protein